MAQNKKKALTITAGEPDPLWYKDAIIYELHVRAFSDSNGDGIGDFAGLTTKLDYLQDLGITAIWLLPFYPSPLRDDGYDIADYNDVNPSYGNLQDVRNFIKEAHRRGLKVITELVCNHTSDQHPWFQRSRRAKPGSTYRDFYVWSDTTEKYQDARIIFKDFETSNWTWDPVAGAYYWHRFYSHQPDLNFENPAVHKAIFKAMEFWLDMGVDGMRLDAIPYLYEEEGSNCENLPRTHEFLKKLRRHMDHKYQGRMFLAEANQWPEDSVEYFGDGDECHMAFHFPVMPRLYMALHMEDRYPIIEIMRQTPAIPASNQWAIFLRNHDELTLEMVTDEERDYMYRVYAKDREARINLGIRRRLAPLLSNHRRKIELMNALLFSLPGTPVLYYGDEIGMGDNIYLGDRNGVRTPMQWNGDRNAGFSRANPQKLYLPTIVDPEYHYEMVNVENQSGNLHSLLWWTKRIIALRKRYKAFGRGTLEFLHPENRRVLCFLRQHEDETILVIVNLSRFVQAVELDLSAHQGATPVELFGEIEFPAVSDRPYFITIGPHSFYWFRLSPEYTSSGRGSAPSSGSSELPMLSLKSNDWTTILAEGARPSLEKILPNYMRPRRWFGAKARKIKSLSLRESATLPLNAKANAKLTIVDVTYSEGSNESYMLPFAYATDGRAEQLLRDWRNSIIARVRLGNGEEGVLYEPLVDREFCAALLDVINGRRRLRGERGEFVGTPLRALREQLGKREPSSLEPSVVRAEQSNSSIIYGGQLILKLYRKLDNGINPDLEIGRVLSEERPFANTPPTAGMIEYIQGQDEPMTLAILQGFVPNQGDAWDYTLDVVRRYFDEAQTSTSTPVAPDLSISGILARAAEPIPAAIEEQIGVYIDSAELLGQRTGELHLALSSYDGSTAFTPEAFSTLYQRSIFQSMISLSGNVLPVLRRQLSSLPPEARAVAEQILARESELHARFQRITKRKIEATRTRHHGDYHLGQVLFTGNDFMIIDFEGEPVRALSERRIKRSPLRDVAGMLRSFQYAAFTVLFERNANSDEERARLRAWADAWYGWVASAFVRSYLATVGAASFIPKDQADLTVLLETFVLEKAIYEIGYEMNNRPTWLSIPVTGMLSILDA